MLIKCLVHSPLLSQSKFMGVWGSFLPSCGSNLFIVQGVEFLDMSYFEVLCMLSKFHFGRIQVKFWYVFPMTQKSYPEPHICAKHTNATCVTLSLAEWCVRLKKVLVIYRSFSLRTHSMLASKCPVRRIPTPGAMPTFAGTSTKTSQESPL